MNLNDSSAVGVPGHNASRPTLGCQSIEIPPSTPVESDGNRHLLPDLSAANASRVAKRAAAFMCCTIFLQMNGVVTTLTNRQCTELMVAVADRKVTMTQLEATLRKKSTPRKFTGTFCGRAKGISS